MLPLAPALRPAERRAVDLGFGLLAAIVAFAALHSLTGAGGAALDEALRDWASSVAYVVVAAIVALRAVRVREHRAAWSVIAAGLTLYALGNLLWAFWLQHLAAPPIPSVSDALWLALYPCAYLGLALMARERGRAVPAGVWLDGVIAGLGMSALGAATVFHRVLESAEGDALAVATNLAYPIADLLLAALVVGILSVRGWRLDRAWALLGGGFLTLAWADCLYLMQVAGGTTDSSLVANVFYMLAVALLAAAAWQPAAPARPQLTSGWMLVIPVAFVAVAATLQMSDHFARLHPLAFGLASATLMAATARIALAFRDLRALAETRRQALTDDLTGLPNRRMVIQALHEELAAARFSGAPLALLMLDLDHFKELNDTLGHTTGDAILRELGPRLSGTLREGDMLARLGGDEFAVLLAAPADEGDAVRAAQRLREAMEAPFTVDGLRLRAAGSIGAALCPAHGGTAYELLQRADIAMYHAKRLGTGHEVYAPEQDRHSPATLALVAELPDALASGQIEAHFQPKADAASGAVVGAEALARWRHPARGLLLPAEFVPAAEHAGLGRVLTRCVLGQALRQCRAWRESGHDLRVAVNTTVADLLDTSLPADVAVALHEAGVPAGHLVLEVTESAVLSDPVRIGRVLVQLRDLGVDVSLDDFGTGYSSLAHLRSLPVDEIKIDRSFAGAMLDDPVAAAIVRAAVGLAGALGVTSVAEGVEDDATWDALAALGCDVIQGFRLSRPLPAAALEPLLRAGRPRAADAA